MMRPLSSANAGGPGAPGPDVFLDTIPEDQSVAQQRVSNLSNVSAVASSDSDDNQNPQRQSQRRRRKHRDGSVASSDANALIEAGAGTDIDTEGQHPKRSHAGFACSARTWAFSLLFLVIAVAIALGVYFIVTKTDKFANKAITIVPSPSDAPSAELTFPPNFYVELNTYQPSTAPSLNPDSVAAMDRALLKLTDSNDYYDETTPQGYCRNWMLTQDVLHPTVDVDGEAAVQQRYILCVFYTSTNGPVFDATVHECDWQGVSCNVSIPVLLYVNEFNLTGTIPSELGYLSQLRLLSLRGNDLTGTIPHEIMQLPNLATLDLSSNSLTGTIPSALAYQVRQTQQQYPPLTELFLYDNKLSGTVTFINTLAKLKVQSNRFTGYDPAYSTLQSLAIWKMYNNSISGTLPQYWDAPLLAYVDLGNNLWKGSIPASLWNLPSLETLILNDCHLTGTLPNTTVSDRWQLLWLHSNRLSGTIPVTFGTNWVNLTQLMLFENSLTGNISQDQCNQWPHLTEFEVDCAKVNVTGNCSTECH